MCFFWANPLWWFDALCSFVSWGPQPHHFDGHGRLQVEHATYASGVPMTPRSPAADGVESYSVSVWLPTGDDGNTELWPTPLQLDEYPDGKVATVNGVQYTLEVFGDVERDLSSATAACCCFAHRLQ